MNIQDQEALDQPAATLRPPQARLIDEGDLAPFARALDQSGLPIATNGDLVTGKPILLVFCHSAEDPILAAGLSGFRVAADRLAQLGATLLVITRDGVEANARTRARLSLPFTILADTRSDLFKAYGVDPYPAVPRLTLFLLDPDHRVARVFDKLEPQALAGQAIEETVRLCAERPSGRLKSHAPVLVLPRMLSLADCAFLAAIWRQPVPEYATDGFTNDGSKAETGDFKVIHDGVYGRAVEYIVQRPDLQQFIDARMRRRLHPEIRKVFQTAGLKREGYRIAGYESRAGGFLNPHRDNAIPVNARRRFTMTVNLNAGEYQGGELRFREYGEELYAVERGTAVVWSASLLHEVLPVTQGRRLVLGVHMFGD